MVSPSEHFKVFCFDRWWVCNVFHVCLYRYFVFGFSVGISFLGLSQRSRDGGEFSVHILFFSSPVFQIMVLCLSLCLLRSQDLDFLVSWNIQCFIVCYNATFFPKAICIVDKIGSNVFMCAYSAIHVLLF